MVDNINMISIKELMARVTSHPLMQDVTLEQGIRYTVDFINIVGYPEIYKNKLADVEIKEHRGLLPCDLVQLVQVMDEYHEALKEMTDNFNQYRESIPAYKVQGRCIFTTFNEGIVKVAYRAMYTDDEGFPMIPDMPLFQKALELYIKSNVFSIKFDLGKINQNVLQHTEQEYCWAVSQLTTQMNTPSIAEMENITNMFNQLIPGTHEYRDGFVHLGDHINLPNRRR